MNRENLQARLQDIPHLSIESRVEAYENLFEKVDISSVEEFETRNGEETVVMEVQRRIWLLYRLAKNLGLEEIQSRSKKLLDHV